MPLAKPNHYEAGKSVLSGKAYVYDGDSIFFGSVEVRLAGIDAPEHDQACRDLGGAFWPCGLVARDRLRRLIKQKQVECIISGKDKYHRLLGVCYVQGSDLNAVMVKEGYAIAYSYFSDAYTKEENEAQKRRRGVWEDAGFTEPYFCRHLIAGHTCYEYDYALKTGRLAQSPLTSRSHHPEVQD